MVQLALPLVYGDDVCRKPLYYMSIDDVPYTLGTEREWDVKRGCQVFDYDGWHGAVLIDGTWRKLYPFDCVYPMESTTAFRKFCGYMDLMEFMGLVA